MNNSVDIENLFKQLAFDARNLIKKHNKYKTLDKGTNDIVTSLDLLIEKHCIKEIKKKFPNASIISEEFNTNTTPQNCTFYIDPIDGTKNFACGLMLYGFQITYTENNETLASVVDIPELNLMVSSTNNNGTFVNNVKTKIKTKKDIPHSVWVVEGNYNKWKIANLLSTKVLAVRSIGCSSVPLALMASNKLDGVIFYRQMKSWDLLPGLHICKNAGICYEVNNEFCIFAKNKELLNFALKEITEYKKIKNKILI